MSFNMALTWVMLAGAPPDDCGRCLPPGVAHELGFNWPKYKYAQ
jgi:hypothetical protein